MSLNLQAALKALPNMSVEQMADLVTLLDEVEERTFVQKAQANFVAFIKAVETALDAPYKLGAHLKRLISLLEDVERGEKDRIAVSIAPRFGKSQTISILYPAWYLGRHPDHKVIVASHTADLAVDMARKVRNLMQTNEYKRIFPGVAIAADAKAAGKWNTNKGGEYYACGTGGALAGRGGHLIIIDDPHSEQDLKTGNFDSVDAAYDWFRLGLRTRLMPEGKLCILHTRWSQRDLIGRLTKEMVVNPDADQYEVFEFPAILTNDKGEEKSLWPEQWSLESLQRTRASMAPWMWNANYMQNPTARDSAIIKKDWIQWWESDTPPSCDFIVQAWDTALTTKDRSDYSVCHTWGVFYDEESGLQNAILLNASKGKYEFPELKAKAHEEYEEWEPDSVIIEAKASGQPLIDEMRRSGIFVQDFSPGKGQDKIARLNSVADMFAAGQVWFPRRRWAEATVDEILTFPSGEHDDEVDATTLALARIRKGGLLPLHTDRKDDMDYADISRPRNYY